MSRLDGGAVGAAAEGTAARAGHVRQSRSAQFGQLTVAVAVAFQFARRECVLAREVLYLGSAI